MNDAYACTFSTDLHLFSLFHITDLRIYDEVNETKGTSTEEEKTKARPK